MSSAGSRSSTPRCATASNRRGSRSSLTRRPRSRGTSSGSASTWSRRASPSRPRATSRAFAPSPARSTAPRSRRWPGRARRTSTPRSSPSPEARHSRLHLFLATSPVHMAKKLGLEPPEVVEQAGWAVAYAAGRVDEIEFSREDATRSDPDFVAEVCRVAIQAGATVINLPDTVGYCLPQEHADFLREVQRALPRAARGHPLRSLPQRPRPGGRQHACRRSKTARADRVHDQRHRRARRQRLARRGRDGAAHARRPLPASRRGIDTTQLVPHQPRSSRG